MKAAFLTPLRLEDTGDGQHWVVLEPLVYRAKDGTIYTVPAGQQTDLFSIPHIVRAVLPKSGPGNAAAVLHDAAYKGTIVPFVEHRKSADGLLHEAMEACDVSLARRRIIYRGVRVGGWWAWRREHPKEAPTRDAV